jgi:hypothetical protein
LGVALLLLGFEVTILGIGFFGAEVSPEYRAYFIDRLTTQWGTEAAQATGLTSR